MRGVLEVGVVGSAKELWARLNDDGGMPAAQIMRVARGSDALGEMAQAILQHLQPGALGLVSVDLPERTGSSDEAVATLHCHVRSVVRIQKQFRALTAAGRLGAAGTRHGEGARTGQSSAVRRLAAAAAASAPTPVGAPTSQNMASQRHAIAMAATTTARDRGLLSAAANPPVTPCSSRARSAASTNAPLDRPGGGSPQANMENPTEAETSPHARHVQRLAQRAVDSSALAGQAESARRFPSRAAVQQQQPSETAPAAAGRAWAESHGTRGSTAAPASSRPLMHHRAPAPALDVGGVSGPVGAAPSGGIAAALGLAGSSKGLPRGATSLTPRPPTSARPAGGAGSARAVRPPPRPHSAR